MELVLIWLGEYKEMRDFRFQWPVAFHHARFMSKAIYMLKLDILSPQLNFLTEDQKKKISDMAQFVSVYVLQCVKAV